MIKTFHKNITSMQNDRNIIDCAQLSFFGSEVLQRCEELIMKYVFFFHKELLKSLNFYVRIYTINDKIIIKSASSLYLSIFLKKI